MRTTLAAEKLEISRATLLRWFHHRKIEDVQRDRNGYRIFTEADLERIAKYRDSSKMPETANGGAL